MRYCPKLTNYLLPFCTFCLSTCPPDYGLFTCAGYPGSILHIEQDAKVTHLLKWLTGPCNPQTCTGSCHVFINTSPLAPSLSPAKFQRAGN